MKPITSVELARRRKISESMKGKKKSEAHCQNISLGQQGKIYSEETKEKISNALKGRKMPYVAEANRSRIYDAAYRKRLSILRRQEFARGLHKRDYIFSEESKKKMSESHKGAKAYNWNPNRTKQLEKIKARNSPEWRAWREFIFKRDDYTCQECGVKGGYLEPHHIIPIRSDWSKLFDTNNGLALCRPCHKKTMGKEKDFQEKYLKIILRGT